METPVEPFEVMQRDRLSSRNVLDSRVRIRLELALALTHQELNRGEIFLVNGNMASKLVPVDLSEKCKDQSLAQSHCTYPSQFERVSYGRSA